MATATLGELATLVGGRVIGDPDLQVRRLASLDEAAEGDITFVSHKRYLAKLSQVRASAVILSHPVEGLAIAQVICANPYLAFAKVLTHLQVRRPEPQGIMAGARVAASAVIGEGVTVHPGCVVGERVSIGRGTILYPGVVLYEGVTVGEDCTLHANVVVREDCRIGNRVIIQPSAIIGSDGFGYAPDGSSYFKIPQVGIVVLEDDVEIGSATCVDRAALGVTRIKRGAKIDNLVQIGHNCVIGEDTVMVSQVGISGSTTVGRHCTFGGQSATAGHLKVGDNVTIGGRGGVTRDVEPNQVLSGLPVMPHKEWLKAQMCVPKLPEMRKEITSLRQKLEDLEKSLKER
ncbi:UDP-3-O-acylglucosamine N-acyltransferase [Desulfuromonas versatilis]|uniref:UDP-3-O-acylglucosamine N-acyltransferase n=1 Tax=Desulfuromonas versatilis TaxID=2802975 RepID=A0ABM8HQD3_9BACT|nr:UDP-3-O-(3-hydroxymyristoyl)glucosamine N-acyltransferase [Desulfuromonas versatilis]BCR05209.1 UDP-3-O-acylglucosamine N-acyltransferase [Desulfuromonas versatilis]